MVRLISLFALATIVVAALAFPNGAPTFVCNNMTPSINVHGRPQTTSSSPYEIHCEQISDTEVQVNVTGTYKGLLVEIRKGRNGRKQLGKFIDTGDDDYKVTCRGNRAITHANKDDKTFGSFIAELQPGEMRENPHCVATIVKDQNTFWRKLTVRADLQEGEEELMSEPVMSSAMVNSGPPNNSGGQQGTASMSMMTGNGVSSQGSFDFDSLMTSFGVGSSNSNNYGFY